MSAHVDFFDERSAEDILCAPAPFSLGAAQEPAPTERRIELSVLFHHVLTMGASDLHIGVGMPPMARVCGALTPIGSVELTDADVDEIIRQVFHDDKATRDALERNRSLDLSFSWPVDGRRVRFRGNCFYELNRRAASFRVIPETIRSIDELGLPRILHDIAQQRRGLFLVTGPTGHGKSTTLAALIREINETRYDHIITIEDPIEFVHESQKSLIRQRQVGTDVPSFQDGLRAALREDPDVILIGELRDLETITAALTAAETGHLVLGTLHTRDAAQTIDRLVDAFSPLQQSQVRIQLSGAVLGICSQQLVPMKDNKNRVCATEVLLSSPAVRNNIREGKTGQMKTVMQTNAESGMHTMEQSLYGHIRSGHVGIEAAIRYAYEPKELKRLLGLA